MRSICTVIWAHTDPENVIQNRSGTKSLCSILTFVYKKRYNLWIDAQETDNCNCLWGGDLRAEDQIGREV